MSHGALNLAKFTITKAVYADVFQKKHRHAGTIVSGSIPGGFFYIICANGRL